MSVFGGSVWEWVEERQQFYLHAFLKEQPDLNYLNHEVQEEMKVHMRNQESSSGGGGGAGAEW